MRLHPGALLVAAVAPLLPQRRGGLLLGSLPWDDAAINGCSVDERCIFFVTGNAKKEIEVQAAKAAQLEKELGSLGKEQLEALEQQRAIEAKAGRSLEQVEVWREREQQLLAEMRELRRDMAACQVQMIPPGLAVVLTCY